MDMLERGTVALDAEMKAEQKTIGAPRFWRPHVRAVLLAALDPEDEALISALVDAPTFGKLDGIDARIIIELIRDHVGQGERDGQ